MVFLFSLLFIFLHELPILVSYRVIFQLLFYLLAHRLIHIVPRGCTFIWRTRLSQLRHDICVDGGPGWRVEPCGVVVRRGSSRLWLRVWIFWWFLGGLWWYEAFVYLNFNLNVPAWNYIYGRILIIFNFCYGALESPTSRLIYIDVITSGL